jgi:hypothetical protein
MRSCKCTESIRKTRREGACRAVPESEEVNWL